MTSAELVARWADKARWATVRRDKEIRAMRDRGASLRTIAEAAKLSHTAVAKILGRNDGHVHHTCGDPRCTDPEHMEVIWP